MTTPQQLDAIPEADRRVIARWLCERAASLRPSIFATPKEVEAISGVMFGFATDLVDPLAEDTTVEHTARVLASLGVVVRR